MISCYDILFLIFSFFSCMIIVADIAVGSWCNGAASIVGTWCLAGSICTAAYYWFTCGVGPAQTCPSWRVAATMLFTGIILYMITVIANSIVLFAGLAGNDNCGQGNEQLVISYTNLAFLYVLALVLCVAFPLALATIRAYALDSAEIGGVGGVGGAAPSRRAAAGITIAHEAALTSLSQHSGEELSVTTPATSLPPPPPPPPVRRADTEQSGSHQEQPELVEESARGGQNTN